jgi:hypothetical protein
MGAGELSLTAATADSLAPFIDARHGSAMHTARSAEFLNWRFVQHPNAHEYFIATVPSTAGSGCAAIIRVLSDRGYRRLNILALAGDTSDHRSVSRLFRAVVRWSVHHSVHHVLFVSSDPSIAQIAKRWFPATTPLAFIYHANDRSTKDWIANNEHRWECLDSDLDLTY